MTTRHEAGRLGDSAYPNDEFPSSVDRPMTEQLVFGDRYRIFWLTGRNSVVAEVRNYSVTSQHYRRVPIILDDGRMQRASMRLIFTTESDRGPEIVVSSDFVSLPPALGEAAIWHEVGHIHHEHSMRLQHVDQSSLRDARIAAIREGTVIPHETEADAFAVERAGTDALICFLTFLRDTRPRGGTTGVNDLGRREIELRIEMVAARRPTTSSSDAKEDNVG